jgi:hypothetical protein
VKYRVVCILFFLLASTGFVRPLSAESDTDPPPPPKRVLGVLPNYRTVDGSLPFAPITGEKKISIALHDSFDWPNYVMSAALTLVAPGKNEAASYGTGVRKFANLYVRSTVDQITGNMLTEGFMPVLLHDDPRYFRKGSGTSWSRLETTMSQIVITRRDTGRRTFNVPEVLGNAIAVGISSFYSPNLRSWSHGTEKLGLMISTDAFSNVMKEFGPDLMKHLPHRHTK